MRGGRYILLFPILLLLCGMKGDDFVSAAKGAPGMRNVNVSGSGLSAWEGILKVARFMGWKVRCNARDEQVLRSFPIRAYVGNRDGCVLVDLMAASAGMDVIIDEEEKIFTLLPEPLPSTEAGRKALARKAVEAYRTAMLNPVNPLDTPALRYHLADLLMSEKEYAAAAGEFGSMVKKALPRDPFLPLACLKAGQCLARLGDYKGGRAYFRKVIDEFRESPLFPEALLGEAECLFGENRVKDGVMGLETYLDRYKGTKYEGPIRVALAEGLFQSKEYARCLQVLEGVEKLFLRPGERRKALYLEGASALRAGDPARAVTGLKDFLLGDPPSSKLHAPACLDLAEALSRVGRYVEALCAVRDAAARKLPPDLLPRWAMQAAAAEKRLARPDKARSVLEAALVKAGGPRKAPEVDLLLAEILEEGGHYEKARALVEELSGMDGPMGDRARALMVECLEAQGRDGEVVEKARAFIPATRSGKALNQLFQALADALTRLGRLDEAARAASGVPR